MLKDTKIPYTPICGIGASAGGVKALQALFRDIPDDLGLAYVVILHLAPDQPSAMTDILGSVTEMSVHQVQDTPKLKPNCVYVIAPDRELVIEGDNIHARPFTQPRGSRAPIDMLFRSVAEGRGDGLAVILTGAGSDGAKGAAAMKEAGGVIFVQDPAEAEFPSMPHSAISTGLADFVAPIAGLAERIAEVARSKEAVRSLDEQGAANDLRRIVNFLHSRTGHDFSSYKRATVMRRVLRRMQVRRLLSLAEYAIFLQENPEEAGELFRDMLISVTQFFRDPSAFNLLAEQVIKPLFDDLGDEGLRCWVPGCATGEEAYSLAILIAEEAARRKMSFPVQIFATDLDEGALATAREGLYPHAIEADVSDERLQRYFVEDGSQYRIRQEIREMVLFASHSVLKDPPFLRLDIISCRNLLIYLERSLQEKLCSVFYYGLRSQRYLFLGSAETADAASELFTPINRDGRLYRSRPNAMRSLPIMNQHFGQGLGAVGAAPTPASLGRRDDRPSAQHAEAIERAAPPSILVDEAHHILHLSPSAGKFIHHSGGPFSGRLSSVVRPELRLDLSHAVDRAIEQKQPTLTLAVPVTFGGETRRIAMSVSPASGEGTGQQALVFFLDGGIVDDDEDEPDHAETKTDEFRRLHAELKGAKEGLSRSRGEHEFAIQELRAANEELQSINEEYRSTAEELETSKEELQSMNEELQTVNSELKSKLESISSAHSDLRNLTAATEIGTLFLDEKLRIRMFTPPIAAVFNITDSDVGRSITDFTNRLSQNRMEDDIRKVLRDLVPIEAEVESTDGRWLMMRIRPYRTIEDRIEGAVVSFVDISGLRGAQQREIESEKRYRMLFDSIDQGFCVLEMIFDEERPADYRFLEVNRAFSEQSGIVEPGARTMREIEPAHEEIWFETYGRVALSREAEHFESAANALGRFFEVYAFPFGEPELRQVGVLFQDISARKQADSEREMLTQELSHRVKNTLAVVQGLASQTSRGMTSVEEFRESFIGRLHALANAHSLLLATQWQSADMKKLVETALDAYDTKDGKVISVNGPAVHLKPKQGLGLSLILHELSTNAAKYGALSTPEGRLDVSWSITPEKQGRAVRFCWAESGGPAVAPPKKKGFGTKLIERASRFELQGGVELKFGSGGCVAVITFPIG
ncbi:chemotaxis protein CheB [Sphingomonas sp.]|uniref:chemotaxis protein CheB n=1 Tax=Sphingomonas sp. TaxID=28214 RepID=UPI003D6D5934